MAALAGSTSILFCGLISDDMEMVLSFHAIAVVLAILAAASGYTGLYHMRGFELRGSPEENLDLPGTSVISQMKQVLTQNNFCLFLIMGSFQAFHSTSSVTS